MTDRTPVLVTTAHRGVYMGWADPDALDGESITLTDCRCAMYWGTTGGFLQLAATGPTEKSRIGAKAPEVLLHKVTSVARCTDEAVAAWSQR